MRGAIAVIASLSLVSPAFAQDEEDPPPPAKTFDVFDEETEEDKQDDLPEGDAEEIPEEEEAEEPAPVEPPPSEPPPSEPPSEPPPSEPPPSEPPAIAPPPPAAPPPIEPRLLVLVIGEEDESSFAQRLGDEATLHLAKVRQLEAMRALDALDPSAEETKREEIEIGRKSVDDGLIAFEDLDLEAAGEKLETAVNALAAYFGELPAPAAVSLSQGIFAYAATTLFEGQTDQADSIFVALVLLDPNFVPEEGRYPSNVIDRFGSVKSAISERPVGSLTVKTNPSGAAVYLDGVYRGSSPVTVSSLADGYHVVSVRRIGFRPLGTMTPVNGDNSATVDLELELSKDTSRLTMVDRTLFRDAPRAAELARALGARELAVLDFARRLSGSVVEGLLVSSDGAVIARLTSTDIVEDPVLAGPEIAKMIVKAERDRIALETAAPPEETPLYEEWWFWAAVGGAVAIAVTSAAVAVTVGEGGPPRNTAIFGF